jgi:hypothetical protein
MHPYRFGCVLGSIAAALLPFCGQPVVHSCEMRKRRGLTLAHRALIVRMYRGQQAQRIRVILPSHGAVPRVRLEGFKPPTRGLGMRLTTSIPF